MFYWAVRELGLSGTFLAEQFGMSQPGVVYAIYEGENTAKENKYQLVALCRLEYRKFIILFQVQDTPMML